VRTVWQVLAASLWFASLGLLVLSLRPDTPVEVPAPIEVAGSPTPAEHAGRTVQGLIKGTTDYVTAAPDGEAFVQLTFAGAQGFGRIVHSYPSGAWAVYRVRRAAMRWSDDGGQWVDGAVAAEAGETLTFDLARAGPHRYWRLLVLESGDAKEVVLGRLSFVGASQELLSVPMPLLAIILGLTSLAIFLLSPVLRGASLLVLRGSFPVAVLTVALLGLAYGLYRLDPASTEARRAYSYDRYIVLEQIRRAQTSPSLELAFFGDSSCLMGVDVPLLRERLRAREVESFCNMGYVGPAGWAHMIDSMVARGAPPRATIIALHPVTLAREESWAGWADFVRQDGAPTAQPPRTTPQAALDYLNFRFAADVLYTPLPGAFATYYGSNAEFARTIRENGGSVVDPSTGLGFSAEEVKRAGAEQYPATNPQVRSRFQMNDLGRRDLAILAASLAHLGRRSVYLIVSPVADYTFPDESRVERERLVAETRSLLTIPAENVVDTPATYPARLFSSDTHLNRWGREVYSEALAAQLRAKAILPAPARVSSFPAGR
jgi:hypothetical protein